MSNHSTEEKQIAMGNPSKSNCTQKRSFFLWVFIFIAIVFSLTIVYLIIEPVIKRKVEVQDIRISIEIPQDSLQLKAVLEQNDNQLNELIGIIDNHNRSILDKYELLVKSKERESDFLRLLSVIVAFIVALIGFLGYRTIKDLEERVENAAKIKADETSKKITEERMSFTVENKLNSMVSNSLVAGLIRSQIMKEINKTISDPMEQRLDKLDERLTEMEDDVECMKEGEVTSEKKPDKRKNKRARGDQNVPEFIVPEDIEEGNCVDYSCVIESEGGEK